MKYKKILIVTFLLLAILTVGAVSASEDADVLAQDCDADVLSQDSDAEVLVDGSDVDVLSQDSDESVSQDSAIDNNSTNVVGGSGYGSLYGANIVCYDGLIEDYNEPIIAVNAPRDINDIVSLCIGYKYSKYVKFIPVRSLPIYEEVSFAENGGDNYVFYGISASDLIRWGYFSDNSALKFYLTDYPRGYDGSYNITYTTWSKTYRYIIPVNRSYGFYSVFSNEQPYFEILQCVDRNDGDVFAIFIGEEQLRNSFSSGVIEVSSFDRNFLNVRLFSVEYTDLDGIMRHYFKLSDLNYFSGLSDGDSIQFMLWQYEGADEPSIFEEYRIMFGDGNITLERIEDTAKPHLDICNDEICYEDAESVAVCGIYVPAATDENGNTVPREEFASARIYIASEDDSIVFFNRNLSNMEYGAEEGAGEVYYAITLSDLSDFNGLENGDKVKFILWTVDGSDDYYDFQERTVFIEDDYLILDEFGGEYPNFEIVEGISLDNNDDPVAILYIPCDENGLLFTGYLTIESDNEGGLYYTPIDEYSPSEIYLYLDTFDYFENIEDGDSIYFDFCDENGDILAHETRRLYHDEDNYVILEEIGEEEDDDIYFNVNHRIYLYKDDDLFAALIYHLERFDNLTGGRILVIGGDNVMFDRNVSFGEDSWSYEINVSDMDHVNELQDGDVIRLVFWNNDGEALTALIGQCHYEGGTLVNDQYSEVGYYNEDDDDASWIYLDHDGNYVCNDILLKFHNHQYYNQTDVIVRVNGREVLLNVNNLPLDEDNVPYCTYADVGITEPDDYEMEVDVTYNLGFNYVFGDMGFSLFPIVHLEGGDPEYLGDIVVELRDIEGIVGGNVVATLTDTENQSFVLFNRSHNDFTYLDERHHGRHMKGNYIVKNDFQINETSTYLVNVKYYDDEGYLLGEDEDWVIFNVTENSASITDEFSIGVRPVAYLNFKYPVPMGSNVVIFMDGTEVYNRVLPLGLEFLSFDLYDHPEFITNTGSHNVTIKFVNEDIGYEEFVAVGQTKYLSNSSTVEIDMPGSVHVGENLTFTVSADYPEHSSSSYRLAVFIDPESMPTFWQYGDEADLFYGDNELEYYVWSEEKVPINLGSLESGTHQIYVAYCLDEEWWDDNELPDFYYGYFNVTVGGGSSSDTVLIADDFVTNYKSGESFDVTLKDGTGNPIRNAAITVQFAGKTSTYKTDSAGRITVSTYGITPGSYAASFKFNGDATHASSSASSSVIINKADTYISAQNITLAYKDSTGELVATITNAYGSPLAVNLNVDFNGESYTLKADSNGQITIPVGVLTPGTYAATISYAGNVNYNPSSATANVVVNKADTVITAPNVSVVYKNSTGELFATITNIYGKPLAVYLNVNLNGESYDVKADSKGQIRIPTADLTPKTYTATITYAGNGNYNPVTKTAKITVKKADTIMTAPDTSVTFKNTTNKTIATLTDAYGKALAVYVNVTLNGEKFVVRANYWGEVSVSTANLAPGTYYATIAYKGNGNYKGSSATAKITVTKADTVMTAPDTSVAYKNTTNKTIATLTDAYGKGLAVYVNVTLNGEKYVVRANYWGEVSVSTANLAPGTYYATIAYKGNGNYKGSSATAKITVTKADVVITASNVYVNYANPNGKLVATITNAYGKALSVYVTVNINGVNYTVRADSNGQIALSTAGLTPKTYTATITYAGNGNYNSVTKTAKITVNKGNTFMIAPNTSVAYKNTTNKTIATLTNAYGKALAVYVNVTINGEKYVVRANSKGEISVSTANLAPGNYTATISYKGNGNYKASTATTQITVNKADTVITAQDVTVKSGDPNGKLTATLTNAYGKALSVYVTVSLNGVDYAVRADSNGKISLPTKDLASGSYLAVISYNGNGNYNPTSTTANVVVRQG